MEELQLLVEALQKGIVNNIYSKLEIKTIQDCINKLGEEIKIKEESKEDNEKPV
jgi:hypothetical protein